jgi:Endodeoxyribonuclease RusA
MNPVTIRIPNERPAPWNTFYSQMHWASRSKEAYRVHVLVACYCQDTEMFSVPVDVRIRVGFNKRPLDVDNVCAKLYIDGMKGLLIADDTLKYVRSVLVEAERSKEAFVEITVVEA